MRSLSIPAQSLLVLGAMSAVAIAQDQKYQRNPSDFPIAKDASDVPTSLTKLIVSTQPKKVVLGSDGSTFDLWKDGVMHLEWAPSRVLVYPIDYLGSFGEIGVYRERSPDAWTWYVYPDGRLYYFANGTGPHVYDTKAKLYERLP